MRLLELTNGADPAELVSELRQTKLNNESQWKEGQRLKKAEETAREDAAQVRRKLSALEEQIASNLNELQTARSDMILMERDKTHYQDTIKLKDQEISFLQAHISQLTQTVQLALPPSKEEARAKSWWQFWR